MGKRLYIQWLFTHIHLLYIEWEIKNKYAVYHLNTIPVHNMCNSMKNEHTIYNYLFFKKIIILLCLVKG